MKRDISLDDLRLVQHRKFKCCIDLLDHVQVNGYEPNRELGINQSYNKIKDTIDQNKDYTFTNII